MKIDYCDCCGRKKKLKEVIMMCDGYDCGTAFYCDDCRRNSENQTVETWKEKNDPRPQCFY